jgi:hypothetical protein
MHTEKNARMFTATDSAAMQGKLTAQPIMTHSSTALLARAASRSRNRLRERERAAVFMERTCATGDDRTERSTGKRRKVQIYI